MNTGSSQIIIKIARSRKLPRLAIFYSFVISTTSSILQSRFTQIFSIISIETGSFFLVWQVYYCSFQPNHGIQVEVLA